MAESVEQALPAPRPEHLEVPTTADQLLTLRKAADLLGWTVPQYVLTAALDRAERDLYEQSTPAPPTLPAEALTPYTALLTPTS
ncbi:DUF1778 domain-containing protein [Actinomadura rupiterrae]|uniref:DUF1778 domain-containing protein n=1 Tax=Actinomadura rupiterrae TaxID=559627 RepID=UPI0020A43DAC|nr:DUF1778 domain-containing protein [Actinomadura rupiterrae]MCP2339692.1 uncharacterized protein (DUF1778 family) [Actinomadura rupiterrae]